jgi:hypothetical protein
MSVIAVQSNPLPSLVVGSWHLISDGKQNNWLRLPQWAWPPRLLYTASEHTSESDSEIHIRLKRPEVNMYVFLLTAAPATRSLGLFVPYISDAGSTADVIQSRMTRDTMSMYDSGVGREGGESGFGLSESIDSVNASGTEKNHEFATSRVQCTCYQWIMDGLRWRWILILNTYSSDVNPLNSWKDFKVIRDVTIKFPDWCCTHSH